MIQYIQPGENAGQELLEAVNKLDRIVIWKNFIKSSGDYLAKYQDFQYVYDNVNKDDVYEFKANYSSYQHADLRLGDALKRMSTTGDLYLVFCEEFTHRNPEIAEALFNSYHSHGDDFVKKSGLNNPLHVSFMTYGNRFSSNQHNAIISNWLIQLSNSKVWRLVSPEYTPYMRPMQRSSSTGFLSGWAYLPTDSKIPYVDVTTEPGDLLFFPPHWWHEVHNIHADEFSLAIGLRTKFTVFPPKWALFPWTSPPQQFAHKISFPFVFATLPKESKKVNSHVGDTFQRIQSIYPDFTLHRQEVKRDIFAKPYTEQDFVEWRETHKEVISKDDYRRKIEL